MRDRSERPSSDLYSRLQAVAESLEGFSSGVINLAHALTSERGATDEAICATCINSLSEYIEAELNGRRARRLYPGVARHLDLCAHCDKAYVDLLELALESDTASLSVPATAFSLDLSFLPPLSFSERLRRLVEQVTASMVEQLQPDSLPDFQATADFFFSRVRDVQPGKLLQLGQASPLGFGEAPSDVKYLVAVYNATGAAIEELTIEDLSAELRGEGPARKLERRARSAARDAGMGRRTAREWAQAYVRAAQLRAGELIDLAQHEK